MSTTLRRSASATPSIDYPSAPVYGALTPDEPVVDYSQWSTSELISGLDADEAQNLFESEVDPEGPFRYTGQFDGWWEGLHEYISNDALASDRVRKAILEMRS